MLNTIDTPCPKFAFVIMELNNPCNPLERLELTLYVIVPKKNNQPASPTTSIKRKVIRIKQRSLRIQLHRTLNIIHLSINSSIQLVNKCQLMDNHSILVPPQVQMLWHGLVIHHLLAGNMTWEGHAAPRKIDR